MINILLKYIKDYELLILKINTLERYNGGFGEYCELVLDLLVTKNFLLPI
jgi:hypothetical protein